MLKLGLDLFREDRYPEYLEMTREKIEVADKDGNGHLDMEEIFDFNYASSEAVQQRQQQQRYMTIAEQRQQTMSTNSNKQQPL